MCYFGDLTIIYFHLIFSRKDKYSGKKKQRPFTIISPPYLGRPHSLSLSLSLSLGSLSVAGGLRWQTIKQAFFYRNSSKVSPLSSILLGVLSFRFPFIDLNWFDLEIGSLGIELNCD